MISKMTKSILAVSALFLSTNIWADTCPPASALQFLGNEIGYVYDSPYGRWQTGALFEGRRIVSDAYLIMGYTNSMENARNLIFTGLPGSDATAISCVYKIAGTNPSNIGLDSPPGVTMQAFGSWSEPRELPGGAYRHCNNGAGCSFQKK